MFFVEVFDYGKFSRVVGGGSTVMAACSVAYRDAARIYKTEVQFLNCPDHIRSDGHRYIFEAHIGNSLSYRIRYDQ